MESNYNFGVSYELDEHPHNIEFALHNHNDVYEIVLLLNGDCEFFVEGNIYKLHKNDIILARPFEFHRIMCLSDKAYERIILYVKTDYFKNDEYFIQEFSIYY